MEGPNDNVLLLTMFGGGSLDCKKQDEPCQAFEKAAPGCLWNVSDNRSKSHSINMRKQV